MPEPRLKRTREAYEPEALPVVTLASLPTAEELAEGAYRADVRAMFDRMADAETIKWGAFLDDWHRDGVVLRKIYR